ncbi:fatty acid-binding protein 2-like [Onthophagus taurus]|uniref:fatty acid-binding protein 2-like n=1 Tax=Onthophagus taurus TaxID=166361 RepID=UPI000C201C46|nr:cellular retinoic acid-binding protein 1-like [Onthophagus taurus]
MVQIEGTYEIVKNENFQQYLKSLGTEMTEDMVQRLNASRSTIQVKLDGNKCSFITSSHDGTFTTLSFEFGISFVDELSPILKLKTTPTFDGATIVNLKSETEDGRGGNRKYEFSNDGLIIYYSTNGSNETARRIYKRI